MSLDKEGILNILEEFKKLKVLVVGDVILDRYIFGKVERISPEAPVPIVEVQREEFRLGGAGNVAHNLSSLGVKTYLLGVVGQDYGRHIIRGLLKEAGIEDLTVEDPQRPTTEKTRIVALSQQLLRVDSEDRKAVEGNTLESMLERLELDVDGIIVSDYAKGVVSKSLMDRIREKRVFFAIDPRPQNKHLYSFRPLLPQRSRCCPLGLQCLFHQTCNGNSCGVFCSQDFLNILPPGLQTPHPSSRL